MENEAVMMKTTMTTATKKIMAPRRPERRDRAVLSSARRERDFAGVVRFGATDAWMGGERKAVSRFDIGETHFRRREEYAASMGEKAVGCVVGLVL